MTELDYQGAIKSEKSREAISLKQSFLIRGKLFKTDYNHHYISTLLKKI